MYHCPECDSTRVQETEWREVNGGDFVSGGIDGPFDTFYCPDCDATPKELTWREIEVSA